MSTRSPRDDFVVFENVKKSVLSRSAGIRVSVFGISPVYKENLGSRTLKNGLPMEIVTVY